LIRRYKIGNRAIRSPGLGPLRVARARACAGGKSSRGGEISLGTRVVQSNSIDVGIAVEAEDGIMVPVIRGADKTSLADLTTKYKEVDRTRATAADFA
jgi:pyruvate/2-oxoglutarate dehydrogenase complex dihydrolipoamide acyltransferase (E2) component